MMVRRLRAIGIVLTMITALVVGLSQSATASSCEVRPPGGYLGYYICEYGPVDQFFWSERDGRGLWPVVGTDGQIYIAMEDGYQTHRWGHWYSLGGQGRSRVWVQSSWYGGLTIKVLGTGPGGALWCNTLNWDAGTGWTGFYQC
jgi:hypothetical protein